MRHLLNLLADLVLWIFNTIKKILVIVFEKFLEINIFEKGIVINTFTAFVAVVLPVARYYIFEQYFYINNPVAHYLIGIVMIMLVTVYFPGLATMLVRIAVSLLYLADVIYLHSAHEISKAPYEITAGYYLNVAVPIIYIVLAAASGLVYRKT